MSAFREPVYGPHDHVYARFPMDEVTGTAGEGAGWAYVSPLWPAGKQVACITE